MDFKIGDKVTYIFTGRECEIIASKETSFDATLGELYPNQGCDFVLKVLDLKGKEFEPYIHAAKDHLKNIRD